MKSTLLSKKADTAKSPSDIALRLIKELSKCDFGTDPEEYVASPRQMRNLISQIVVLQNEGFIFDEQGLELLAYAQSGDDQMNEENLPGFHERCDGKSWEPVATSLVAIQDRGVTRKLASASKKADTSQLADVARRNGVTRMFDWDTNIDDVISDMVSDDEVTLAISTNANGSEAGILLPLINEDKPVFLPMSFFGKLEEIKAKMYKLQDDIEASGNGV